MSEPEATSEQEQRPLLEVSAEHRQISAAQFERANQVITTGNFDYGIQLLLNCCKLDPANLIYRQALRKTEKAKYKNNLRGSRLAAISNSAAKAKIKTAKHSKDYLKVLEVGEEILARNPWDTGAQLDMAEAADALGLLDLGVWLLEQSRQKDPKDLTVNRALARLYEKRGNFTQAIALWEMIRKARPTDPEAQHKAKDLAASDTIARTQRSRQKTEAPNNQAASAPSSTSGAAAPAGKPASQAEPTTKSEAPAQESSEAVPSLRMPFDRAAQEANNLRAKIDADPTNANGYLHLASVFRRAGQVDQAREILEQGLGPTGNNFDIQMELAELDLEPFRQNLTVTEQKLKAKPQDEELRKIRVRLMKEINTRELDLFRRKVERYPTDKGSRFEMGVRLLRAQQIDEAIRELQNVRNDPRYQWKALLYLGFCFKARNNWRLAQRNFEEALTHLPANEDSWRKEILFQLAQGAADAGDFKQAIDLGTELANLDFAYHDIGRLLDEWQEKQSSRSKV